MHPFWCKGCFLIGVEMTLANWKKMPRALFAKAWVTTGHITKEKMMEVSGITAEEWSNCSLLMDPSNLADHLGEAAEEPSVQELVQNGQFKRKRVIWLISPRGDAEASAILPACLQFPLEKRLSNHLFLKAAGTANLKALSTVVISRRGSKEVSAEMLRKHFTSNDDGTKALKPTAPTRSVKEHWVLSYSLLQLFWLHFDFFFEFC